MSIFFKYVVKQKYTTESIIFFNDTNILNKNSDALSACDLVTSRKNSVLARFFFVNETRTSRAHAMPISLFLSFVRKLSSSGLFTKRTGWRSFIFKAASDAPRLGHRTDALLNN